MTDTTTPRQSREFLIDAIPIFGGGFYSEIAYPGRVPEYIHDKDGVARIFNTEIAAIGFGARTLIKFLNDRLVPEPNLRFTHMHGGDFAVALAETGMPLIEFAMLYGTTQEKVHAWIDGTKEVPFPMWFILESLMAGGGIDRAKLIIAAHADLRNPSRQPRSMRTAAST